MDPSNDGSGWPKFASRPHSEKPLDTTSHHIFLTIVRHIVTLSLSLVLLIFFPSLSLFFILHDVVILFCIVLHTTASRGCAVLVHYVRICR